MYLNQDPLYFQREKKEVGKSDFGTSLTSPLSQPSFLLVLEVQCLLPLAIDHYNERTR